MDVVGRDVPVDDFLLSMESVDRMAKKFEYWDSVQNHDICIIDDLSQLFRVSNYALCVNMV